MSHKIWRKLVKKLRRKRKRQKAAQDEEKRQDLELSIRMQNPHFIQLLQEQREAEEQQILIEEEQAAQRKADWLRQDLALHNNWLYQKSIKEKQLLDRQKQEELIRKEWQEKQEKEENKEPPLLQQAKDSLQQNATRLPSPPPGYVRNEERPGREECSFFKKTGACRFGVQCTREHIYPAVSTILMFPNMYNHPGLASYQTDDYDTDVGLEYSESETLQHFKDFYLDIFPEFERCGGIKMLVVCCNHSVHLRGNVYVQYHTEDEAMVAYGMFNGRFYGGKRLSCSYVVIERWKSAVCGQFWRNKCPKGTGCNFLHTFRNPGNSFNIIENEVKSHSFGKERNSTGYNSNSYNGSKRNGQSYHSPTRKSRSSYSSEISRSTRRDRFSPSPSRNKSSVKNRSSRSPLRKDCSSRSSSRKRQFSQSPTSKRKYYRSPPSKRKYSQSPPSKRKYSRSPPSKRKYSRSPTSKRKHSRSPPSKRNYSRSPPSKRKYYRSPSNKRKYSQSHKRMHSRSPSDKGRYSRSSSEERYSRSPSRKKEKTLDLCLEK